MKSRIKSKILKIFLGISLSGLIVFIAIFEISMIATNNLITKSTTDIGDKSSEISSDLLLDQSFSYTKQIVQESSNYVHMQLEDVATDLTQIADVMTYMYNNKQDYNPKVVKSLPELVEDGETEGDTLQYALSPNTTFSSIKDELYLQGNLLPLLESTSHNREMITSIYLASKSGFTIGYDENAKQKADAAGLYYEARTRPWYLGAKELEDLYISAPYPDTFGRGLTITMAIPYYTYGIFQGVVGLDVLIETINQDVLSANIGSDGYAMLIAEDGKVISASGLNANNERDLDYFLGSNAELILADMKDNDSGSMESLIQNNESYVIYNKIEINNWYYIAVLDLSSIKKSAEEVGSEISLITQNAQNDISTAATLANITLFILFGVIISIVVFMANKLSFKIANPILQLNEGVNIISNGDFSKKVDIKTNDEIEDLGNSFNKMTFDLITYMENLKNVTAEKERIGAELDVATDIQASMLPSIFPPYPDRDEFDIFASMVPAKEVGGDFYDFFLIDDTHLAVVIADVSGKGVPAALFMVITKTLIKNYAQLKLSSSEVFTRANEQLCEGNKAGMFVTAFMGILEIETGKFTYVNAGHNPPLVKKSDGDYEWLRAPAGFVLAGMEGIKYKENVIDFEIGDTIYMYTDGVTEATNSDNELFSDPKLKQVLNKNKDLEISDILTNVKTEIDRFVGDAPQFDDITMLACKYNGANMDMDKINVPATLDNLPEVLQFIDEKLKSNNCPPSDRTQILVAVEEIFVNIAKYAYTPSSGEVTIGCTATINKITIQFTDSGVPFNPLERKDPDITLPSEERNIGGLGIYMVKTTMDDVKYNYSNNKNILTILKGIN